MSPELENAKLEATAVKAKAGAALERHRHLLVALQAAERAIRQAQAHRRVRP